MQPISRRIVEHPTLALAVLCAVLVVAALVVSSSLRGERTPTMRSVAQEVEDDVDRMTAALPGGVVVDTVSETTTRDCPDGSGGSLLAVSRTITLASAFDASAWVSDLSRGYVDDEGWTASVSTLGSRDHVRTTLVSPALMVYTITTGTDASPAVMRIRADSRCATR